MKKVLLAVAVVAFFASCKKDYTCSCTILGTTTSVDYPGLSKDEAKTTEAACTTGGFCTWAEKWFFLSFKKAGQFWPAFFLQHTQWIF